MPIPLRLVRLVLLPLLLAMLPAQERDFASEFQAGLDALRAGRFDEGVACFERCLERRDDDSAAYNIACAYAMQGKVEQGLQWVRKSIEMGWARPDHLLWDKDLDNLRGNPGFEVVLLLATERQAAAIAKSIVDWRPLVGRRRADLERAEQLARLSRIRWQDGHTGERVLETRFSPDGETLLTYGMDGLIRAWNSRTGAHLADLGRRSPINVKVEYSSDGERILVLDRPAGRVFLWDGHSLERVASLGADEDLFWGARFHPNGTRLATATVDGRIRIWDARSGRAFPQPVIDSVPIQHNDRSFWFSPDGSALLVHCQDLRARLYDAETGGLRATFGKAGQAVDHAQFTTDGQRVVAWSSSAQTLRIFANDQPEQALFEGRNTFNWRDAPTSPDGRFVVTRRRTVAADLLQLWEVDGGKVVAQLGEHARPAALFFSPDGRHIVTSSADQLRIWNGRPGELRHELKLRAPWLAPWFDPRGRYLIARVNAYGGAAVQIDLETGQVIREEPPQGYLEDCAFHGDRFVIAGYRTPAKVFDGAGDPILADGKVRVVRHVGVDPRGAIVATLNRLRRGEAIKAPQRSWDPATGATLDHLVVEGMGWSSIPQYADGKQLLVVGGPQGSRLDVRAPGAPVPDHQFDIVRRGGMARMRASPDGQRVLWAEYATPPAPGTAALIDTGTGQAKTEFDIPNMNHTPESPIPEFHPSGRFFVSSAFEPRRLIEVRDGRSGELLRTLDAHRDLPRHYAFSPDGRYMVSSSVDHTARLWDCDTWQPSAPVTHEDDVWYSAFSPDSSRFVTVSKDLAARVCMTADPTQQVELRGHNRQVRFAVFHPDGERVLTCSRDGTARLWNATTGEQLRELRGHTGEVVAAEFLPDNERLLTWSDDGTTRIWDVDAGALLLTRVEYADGNWLSFTPQGYYVASPDAPKWAQVRVRDELYPLSCYADLLQSAELVASVLAGDDVQAPPELPPAPRVRVSSPRQRNNATTERTFLLDLMVEDVGGIQGITVVQDGEPVAQEIVTAAMQRSRSGRRHEARLTMQLRIPDGRDETQVVVRAENRRRVLSRPHSFLVRYEQPQSDLYLLALGVQDYDDDQLDLTCPRQDVDAIEQAFASQQGQLFRKVHVRTLRDGEVTAPALYKLRESFLSKAREQDTIVVFFAGHGVRTPDTQDYWFLTPSATPTEPWSGINRQVVDSLVTWSKLAATSRVLLIDTCHAGQTLEGVRSDPRGRPVSQASADRMLQQSRGGLYVIAASTDQGLARERDGHGLFTAALLAGMRGEADRDGDGVVAVDELLPFVRDKVHELSKGTQRPTIPRIEGGQGFPLFRVGR